MLKLVALKKPDTLEAAYALLQNPKHVALAGGTMFQLGDWKDLTGVELTHLLGKRIFEEGGTVHIEAMTTLRALETEPLFMKGPLSILPKSVLHLMGPAFRNMATVGGAAGARFGGSELLTALLALDAEVILYARGKVSLESYLKTPIKNDIVCEVVLSPEQGKTGHAAACNADTDEPLLCAAVRRKNGVWRIAVGARPQIAQVYVEAVLPDLEDTARRTVGKIRFGNDIKASAEYRRAVCPTIIRRAMEEALGCE